MDKPSLHEIAAMPFPASRDAMRKHYIHDWGKPIPEELSKKQTYQVTARVSVRTVKHERLEIEAWTEDEAAEEAESIIDKRNSDTDDFEIDDLQVKLVETRQ